jgi:hypothetical protein
MPYSAPGECETDGVEGERIELVESAFDDRVVDPPNNRDAQQDEVHPAGA